MDSPSESLPSLHKKGGPVIRAMLPGLNEEKAGGKTGNSAI